MYCGRGVDKQWNCGKGGTMNLQKMGSLMRDMGEPCLSQSPIKVSRVLKPEKWQASFDVDGKVSDFQKSLKSIMFAGVDPSIRPEVWEFLLGCYTPGSTAEQRKQLRTARRERYRDLIKLCQLMHSSIGTGSLAYVVGSKVMDMRTSSKNDWEREEKVKSRQASVDKSSNLKSYYDSNNNCTDTSCSYHRDSSTDLVSVRGSTDVAAYESSCFVPASDVYKCSSSKQEREAHDLQFATETDTEFPSPMTDVFEKNGKYEKECGLHEQKPTKQNNLRVKMHSFQINNNSDLVKESTSSPSNGILPPLNSEIEMVRSDSDEKSWSRNQDIGTETANTLRISDVPGNSLINAIPSQDVSEERVSEWLWNLHRIVVDVVRTDSHLEFYEDTRNLARMSDILAVYAWVDPATGYCQGMSDLLSPFVVLFEDDADAFWCFEMLLRRMRENFQMEGPTGVMKQLEVLWRILELTDREIFLHLSHIGAESLHFAFRMLLVLFRRELSFNEALLMWEMMWAADFNDMIAYNLEKNCLETLVIQLPSQSEVELREESLDNGSGDSKGDSQTKHRVADGHPFCGLTKHFFSRNDRLQIHSAITSTSNGTDGLPVFCVAAILILNRHKIMREARSFDDMIKIFNDNVLKINVKRCIRTAIKIRKKYFCKLIRRNSPAVQNGD